MNICKHIFRKLVFVVFDLRKDIMLVLAFLYRKENYVAT